MEQATLAEEKADKRSQARLKQLQNSKGQKQKIKIDPIKSIREMNALGRYQEAIDMAQKVAEEFPDHAKLHTWWGISLVKLKKKGEAINHLSLQLKRTLPMKKPIYIGV